MFAETDYEAMVTEKGAYFLAGIQDLRSSTRSSVTSMAWASRSEWRFVSRTIALRLPSDSSI